MRFHEKRLDKFIAAKSLAGYCVTHPVHVCSKLNPICGLGTDDICTTKPDPSCDYCTVTSRSALYMPTIIAHETTIRLLFQALDAARLADYPDDRFFDNFDKYRKFIETLLDLGCNVMFRPFIEPGSQSKCIYISHQVLGMYVIYSPRQFWEMHRFLVPCSQIVWKGIPHKLSMSHRVPFAQLPKVRAVVADYFATKHAIVSTDLIMLPWAVMDTCDGKPGTAEKMFIEAFKIHARSRSVSVEEIDYTSNFKITAHTLSHVHVMLNGNSKDTKNANTTGEYYSNLPQEYMLVVVKGVDGVSARENQRFLHKQLRCGWGLEPFDEKVFDE